MGIFDVMLRREPTLLECIPHALKGVGHYGEWLTEFALTHNDLSGRMD